ncbi:MAG TPA: SUMF1/EgtB/PvdO family nonheme iron enzyme [Myxococcota bacterium]|nr:SUMF1/EgtB/PvdO family nonheme iron enzyme [Myxococcota bacterium]HRY92776.1 SUMF1/EgtB/PvdO family nonheme iron enzyme [Myxococcota bacterium]HSA20429.1 SUMF1/EgtB/PvdO family nonheme iron enzyme [Myxococcota bacterium]
MRRQAWTAVALGLLAGLAAPGSAQEGPPGPVVAVFDIQTKRIAFPPDVLEGMTDYLGSLLAKHGYQVVPRSQLRERLTTAKTASYKECYEESCQIEIGKELAADKSLATQILKLGGQCKVTVALYDLKKATSERAGTQSGGCEEAQVVQALERAVLEMVGAKVAPAEPVAAPDKPSPGPALEMMIQIPAGESWMGCSLDDFGCKEEEKPLHKVHLGEFWMDATEVTVAAYRRCVEAGRCEEPGTQKHCNWAESGREQHPINCVSWDRARAYCGWVGKRLPTEAEWEKAARGGSIRARYGELGAVAWFGEGLAGQTHPVRQKQPNGFGLHDTLGNVWEWCADWSSGDYYQRSPARNPPGPARGESRVLRGGSWSDPEASQRVSARKGAPPEVGNGTIGFRCAKP